MRSKRRTSRLLHSEAIDVIVGGGNEEEEEVP